MLVLILGSASLKVRGFQGLSIIKSEGLMVLGNLCEKSILIFVFAADQYTFDSLGYAKDRNRLPFGFPAVIVNTEDVKYLIGLISKGENITVTMTSDGT